MTERQNELVTALPPALSKISAFPPLAIRVLHLLSNEDVEIRQLLELLIADPGFSAEILRIANSPLYGFESQIDSVQHALVILGLERIKAITLTVATGFYIRGLSKIDMLRRCWRYSLACALLAEELAHACGVHQDQAYTAALLHDVGRLGLLIGYPDQYTELIREANEAFASGRPFDLREEERRLFGIDRCEAGRLLATKWNLPQEFQRVAGYHLDFPPSADFDLLALVRLSCGLANSLGFDLIHSPNSPGFQDLVARLPERERSRFPSDPESLRLSLASKIDSHDLDTVGGAVPSVPAEAAPASNEAKESAQPVAEDEEPVPPPEEDHSTGRSAHRLTTLDIAIFLAGTLFFGILFMVLLLYIFGDR